MMIWRNYRRISRMATWPGLMLLAGALGAAWPATAMPLTARLRHNGATIESKEFEIAPFRLVHRAGNWRALDALAPMRITAIDIRDSSDLDPALGVITVAIKEGNEEGEITLWVAAGKDEHSGRLEPFLCRVRGKGFSTFGWDVNLAIGDGPTLSPDRDRVTLWTHANVGKITDAGFLGTVADHIWHNQDLDNPSGSFNRIIDLNLRALEIDAHVEDLYSTTAWLLWSKWVTWKQAAEQMPDGEKKLDEALALLVRGDKANPGNARYLYEAGTVLIPVLKHHRPDLRQVVGNYLRRAAETAREGDLVVKARRTYAGHLFAGGQYKQARKWYEKLLEADADNVVALQRLREIADKSSPDQ